MIFDGKTIIYNADDEEARCINCDNYGGDFDCVKLCGPDHGWYGYQRTEDSSHGFIE